MENLITQTKSNGVKYTVRQDRRRYFFPSEWKRFISSFNNEQHILFFNTLINTGARAMEALHLKPDCFDFERGTVEFRIVKKRSANKRNFSLGKSRRFFVTDKYLKEMKSYIKRYSIENDGYIFISKKELPENYEALTNVEKKKYYISAETAYFKLMKAHLKLSKIEDWYNFSLHNIRKTYGNWMRAFNIDNVELCYRLGHDFQTYMSNYGNTIIFNQQERIEIVKILGDIK